MLILGIADYIENPERVILSEGPGRGQGYGAGRARFSQGFDEYELLKEYEIFGGILFSFLSARRRRNRGAVQPRRVAGVRSPLFLAVALIEQAT